MSDSPAPPAPRRRLSSTSGALAAVRPENVARAVDDLQTDMLRVRWKIEAHEERIDEEARARAKLEEMVIKRFDKSDENDTQILMQIASLNLKMATTEGQNVVWKVAPVVGMFLIALVGLLWNLFGHK